MAITILLADGVTPNDTDHRFVATSLDGLIEGYIVASADHYSADATFTMPTEWQVSFAAPWDTWYGAAEAPAACPEFGDVAMPVKFRQHSYGTTDSSTFSTAGTDTACTALTAISDLVASDGNQQSVLTWGAVSNEDSFVIEYCAKATDPGTGSWAAETGYTSTTAAQNDTTKTITGLTNSTKYWFRIKSLGSGRYSDSAWSNNDDATPNIFFTNNYATGSTDTTVNITAFASGTNSSASVASGVLHCIGDSADDINGFVINKEIGVAVEVIRVKASTNQLYGAWLVLNSKATIPTAADLGLGYGPFARRGSTATTFEFGYRDNSNTLLGWKASTNEWIAWASKVDTTISSGGVYTVELVSDGTSWHFVLKDSGGSTVETTSDVAWAQTYDPPAGHYWVVGGDIGTGANQYGTIDFALIERAAS